MTPRLDPRGNPIPAQANTPEWIAWLKSWGTPATQQDKLDAAQHEADQERWAREDEEAAQMGNDDE